MNRTDGLDDDEDRFEQRELVKRWMTDSSPSSSNQLNDSDLLNQRGLKLSQVTKAKLARELDLSSSSTRKVSPCLRKLVLWTNFLGSSSSSSSIESSRPSSSDHSRLFSIDGSVSNEVQSVENQFNMEAQQETDDDDLKLIRQNLDRQMAENDWFQTLMDEIDDSDTDHSSSNRSDSDSSENGDGKIRSPIQSGEFVDDYFNSLMAASGELSESWVEVGCEEGQKEMVKRRRRNHLKRTRCELPGQDHNSQDLKGLVRSEDCDGRGSCLFANWCPIFGNGKRLRQESSSLKRRRRTNRQRTIGSRTKASTARRRINYDDQTPNTQECLYPRKRSSPFMKYKSQSTDEVNQSILHSEFMFNLPILTRAEEEDHSKYLSSSSTASYSSSYRSQILTRKTSYRFDLMSSLVASSTLTSPSTSLNSLSIVSSLENQSNLSIFDHQRDMFEYMILDNLGECYFIGFKSDCFKSRKEGLITKKIQDRRRRQIMDGDNLKIFVVEECSEKGKVSAGKEGKILNSKEDMNLRIVNKSLTTDEGVDCRIKEGEEDVEKLEDQEGVSKKNKSCWKLFELKMLI
ncbi:hypothetical protein BY996DRAFT_6489748 [Phakopsora pachyrhizi]|uniref:Expressed protein n=1 Tax=Phakopsora pachyrhizi TaxID=170000 RepID=A0AAV0BCW2_PHAPC|nr:hypothetical protein BY996DRAFT_6489748 [Phakopsora pachyrhizi]CAH7683716.1 expressed protein [Phakopsora pachyrhizi]